MLPAGTGVDVEIPSWWITPAAVVAVALVGALVKWLLWIGSMNEHKSEASSLLREIRADIKKIFQRLPAEPIGSASPRALTDYGQRIADAVDAKIWAEREAQNLDAQAEGRRGYEIEDLAFQHVETHELSPDIRETAFEQGFTVAHVRDVLAVVLRDVLLDRREPV